MWKMQKKINYKKKIHSRRKDNDDEMGVDERYSLDNGFHEFDRGKIRIQL